MGIEKTVEHESDKLYQLWFSKNSQGVNNNYDNYARRRGNVHILDNTGGRHHQISGDERKNLKKSTSGKRENYSKQNYITGIDIKAVPFVRYLGPFLKLNREELKKWTREQENLWPCVKPWRWQIVCVKKIRTKKSCQNWR